jgi:integrase
MDLADILERQFFPLQTRIANETTRDHYRRAVRWLGEMLGRPAVLTDLTDDSLSAILRWLTSARSQSPVTANGSMQCLSALWRWCRDRDLPIRGGPTVRPLREPIRTPRAWSVAELDRLCAAADASIGSIGGMPARTWWLTLFALVMDSGCRSSELLALDWAWIDWERGWIYVPAECRKGQRRDEAYGLRPDTLSWLAKIRQPQGQILGWGDRHISLYHLRWNELLTRAGLPNGRYNQAQKLRRTFATLLTVAGGDATAALGHASRATTLRSYLDPSVCRTRHADLIPFHPLRGISG